MAGFRKSTFRPRPTKRDPGRAPKYDSPIPVTPPQQKPVQIELPKDFIRGIGVSSSPVTEKRSVPASKPKLKPSAEHA
jgi:hypothetical protein